MRDAAAANGDRTAGTPVPEKKLPVFSKIMLSPDVQSKLKSREKSSRAFGLDCFYSVKRFKQILKQDRFLVEVGVY